MAFLLNSQALGVSDKNEQSTQTPWRGAPEAWGPMQLHWLHRLKAGPGYERGSSRYIFSGAQQLRRGLRQKDRPVISLRHRGAKSFLRGAQFF